MSRIKPRTASVVIYQGDDDQRLAELSRAVSVAQSRLEYEQEQQRAARSNGARRGGDDLPDVTGARESVEAAERAYSDFVRDAADRAEVVEVRSLGRRRFAELVAAHPPRPVTRDGKTTEHDDDRAFGVDVTTFPMALLKYADERVRTIVEPAFDSDRDRDDFLDDDLSEGDFDRLWTTAYGLNRAAGADPKDAPFYSDSPSSATT